jgi:glycosyltransferase involved in cell wall biosynthesis
MPAVEAPQITTDQPALGLTRHIVVGITHPQTCLILAARLRALREAGFRVSLICSPGVLFELTAQREGAEAFPLSMHRGIAPVADFVSLIRLWKLLRRLKPDMTEFSTPKAGLLGTLAARLVGVPLRIYMLRGLKLETSTGFKRRILLAMERLASACAHVVLCNSESLRAEAFALGLTCTHKLQVLGDGSSNGVDVRRFSPGPSNVRSQLGLSSEAPVIGFAGRLTLDKGLPELIEAFDAILETVPRAQLLLVGWFDESEDLLGVGLRSYIADHPHIHCTGFVTDTAPYYRAMDMLVLPTWREGFPNVVLEAAATGIPVITTGCTGSRDSVLPEVTGLLIPPGYPEAITESVLKLVRDPQRRRRMGEAGRAWILEHYVDKDVLALISVYYKSLLDSAIGETDSGRSKASLADPC